MRFTVHVKPNSRRNEVIRLAENEFTVRVTAPPVDGKANDSVIELLAEHLHVPRRGLSILRGHSSRLKIIELSEQFPDK